MKKIILSSALLGIGALIGVLWSNEGVREALSVNWDDMVLSTAIITCRTRSDNEKSLIAIFSGKEEIIKILEIPKSKEYVSIRAAFMYPEKRINVKVRKVGKVKIRDCVIGVEVK